MELEVRDAVEGDAAGLSAVWAAVFPHLVMMTPERVLHRLVAAPPEARDRTRVVTASGGAVVAFARSGLDVETSEPGHGHVVVAVLPGHRRRGLGSALLEDAVGHLAGFSAVTLHGRAADDGPASAFLQDRGWEATSVDRFQRADLPPPAGTVGPLPAGVHLRPVAEADPRAVWRADAAATLDIPGDVVADAMSYEHWLRDVWGDPTLDRALSRVALEPGGEVVAVTLLQVAPVRRAVWSGMTGTVRGHRGRGLASAVKADALRAAGAAGYTEAWTGNDDTNLAMRAVNARLGYRLAVTAHGLVRHLR